ncbi:MAG: Spy/CpxP family protein refolding chaperone [Thiohalorhabdaceae bacterium]
MNRGIRKTAILVGTLAAITLSAPVHAEDDAMPRMQKNRSGMMGGGGMGMMGGGMMGGGRGMGMMGGGMMGPGMMSGGMGMMGPMSSLALSDEQIQNMTEMHKQMAREHADMMGDMPAMRYRLSRELAKDEPDAEQVGELFLQMQKKRRQLMQDRMKMRQQMMEMLSKEQRQQMMENMRQMRKGGGSGKMPMQNR